MKRLTLLICVLGLLALPQAASARVVELGSSVESAAKSVRMTLRGDRAGHGYQADPAASEPVPDPALQARSWPSTVTLARVTPQQADFFNGLCEARRASACRSCAGARRGGRASATG